MTRYSELSRKAESLWRAAEESTDTGPYFQAIVKKYIALKYTMRGLSIDQAEQSATDRRNHVLSSVGLQLVEYRREYTRRYDDFWLNQVCFSVHDSSTGLPVTWGSLIERMNGR